MSHRMTSLGSRLTDPRKMLLVAGLLVAMGLVAGYVEVHQQADRTLALREGPPPTVTLQNFDADLNTGPAREVSVFAEADFRSLLLLTQRETSPTRRAVVVPLFPLSATGADLIAEKTGRDAPTVTNTERVEDDPLPPALGFLFEPLAPASAPPRNALLAAEVYGIGAYGTVVKLSGAAADAGAFTLMADGAFTAMNLELAATYLAVDPYVEGREAALTAKPSSQSHRVLYWVAVVLALIAAATSLRPVRDEEDDEDPMPGDESLELEFVKAHPKFTPIPSQRALQAATRPMPPERKPGAAAKALKWGKRSVGQTLRSRQQRPEDEAP